MGITKTQPQLPISFQQRNNCVNFVGVSRTALTHSAVRSPLSKAPRLGMATTSRRSMQGTLNKNNTPGTSSTTGNKEISLSSISNALKQDCTGSQSQMPTSSTKITKIAPIFLPAAERNMVQNSKVVECDKIVSGFLLESIVDSESQDQNFIENSKHFNGNTVLLNLDQPKESAWGANKTKPCPFYKKLPGMSFRIHVRLVRRHMQILNTFFQPI